MSAPATTPTVPAVPSTPAVKTAEVKSPDIKVPAAAPELIEVKVNGKKQMVSIDDLKRTYSLETASRQRFTEAEKKLKEASELKSIFSNKDIDSLVKAGWTEQEIEAKAAEFLVKRAKEQSMTPEQKRQALAQAEYERLKKEHEERELTEKTKAQQALEQREAQIYQTQFLGEVAKADKQTWLDLNDPIILSHVINDVTLSLKNHGYDMPVLEAVRRLEEKLEKRGPVKKEYWKKLSKNGIKGVDDSDLDTFFESGVKGIREKSVAAIKRAEAPFAKQTTAKPEPTAPPKHDAAYYRNIRYNRNK